MELTNDFNLHFGSTPTSTVLRLALGDYLDTRYIEPLYSVADKHHLSLNLMYTHCMKYMTEAQMLDWQRYNTTDRKTTTIDKDGMMRVVRPHWFTGNPSKKFVLRHHVLWCLVHGETAVPKGYIVWCKGNYHTAAPLEFTLLTRGEHQAKLQQMKYQHD